MKENFENLIDNNKNQVFIISNYLKIFSFKLAHIFLVTNEKGILNRYEFSQGKNFCVNKYTTFQTKKLFNILPSNRMVLLESFQSSESDKIIETLKNNIDFYKNKKYNINNFNCFSFIKDLLNKSNVNSNYKNYFNLIK